MRGSAATVAARGRRAIDTLRTRLRDGALPPLLVLVLVGVGGYAGPAQPLDVVPVAVTRPAVRASSGPGSGAAPVILAAPEQALEAVRVAALGAASSAAAALYDAYVAAAASAPARCHLSPSVLAALGQAEQGPLSGTGSPHDLAAAAVAAADSLCAHGRDLARPADLRAALLARTGSPVVVRLVLTLKARYDLMGLGLVGAPGPVLVPLLLQQATALVADPYGPALVHPSPAPRGADDGRILKSVAAVHEPAEVSTVHVTGGPKAPAATGAASAAEPVPVAPAGEPAGVTEVAEPSAAAAESGSASPGTATGSTGAGDASAGTESPAPSADPTTGAAEPTCATGSSPDAGTPSDPPPTEVVEPTAPGTATGDTQACPTEPAPDAGGDTAAPDPAVDASATADPAPAQETSPALP